MRSYVSSPTNASNRGCPRSSRLTFLVLCDPLLLLIRKRYRERLLIIDKIGITAVVVGASKNGRQVKHHVRVRRIEGNAAAGQTLFQRNRSEELDP